MVVDKLRDSSYNRNVDTLDEHIVIEACVCSDTPICERMKAFIVGLMTQSWVMVYYAQIRCAKFDGV